MLRNDSTSILALYRRLLSLRRSHDALATGAFRLIGVQGNVLIYERSKQSERILVCLNFSDSAQAVTWQQVGGAGILASTHPDRTDLGADLILRPNEGLTILLAS
jgi:alpha-glucosidase